MVPVTQPDSQHSQQESGSDAAATPETRTETKKNPLLARAESGRGKGSKDGEYLQLRPPAASGPVRMLWFVV